MQKIVEEPAEETCEWNALEVSECSSANPETSTVIAEEVLGEGDVVNRRGRGGFSRDSRTGGWNVTSAILDMEIVPRIPSTTEGLGFGVGGLVVGQGTSNNNTMVLGEENAVDVVIRRVLGLGADTSNSLGDAADHLGPIDSIVEEAVFKRGALAGRAGEPSSGGDAWKLHDDRRDKAMLQRGLDELVHGDIRLDESSAGGTVDLEDITEGADVDDGLASLGPGAVRAAVEDAVGLAALEEAADGRGDGGDGLFMALHGWAPVWGVRDEVWVFVLRCVLDQRHFGEGE
ncbi:hypothetical protein HG530_009805 [Fusarium avenaceum]|nr:hypothetical protein HG530_009805 [Fusarium avenaceum]